MTKYAEYFKLSGYWFFLANRKAISSAKILFKLIGSTRLEKFFTILNIFFDILVIKSIKVCKLF